MILQLNENNHILLYSVLSRKQWKNIAVLYVLVDPRDMTVRYVGKSVNGINRAYEHTKPSSLRNDGNTRKANWIRALLNENLKPLVFIADYFPLDINKDIKNDYIYNKEQKLIDLLKTHGAPLTNSTDGGKGAVNRIISDETREKMRTSAKSRKLPDALLLNQKPKYGPPVPREHYYKKRPRKDPENKYLNSLKKKVRGINLTTNTEVYFDSVNDCERYFKGKPETNKFNRRSLRHSIKDNRIYYGFYWSFI